MNVKAIRQSKTAMVLSIVLFSLNIIHAQSGGWDSHHQTGGVTGYNDWGNGVIQLLNYNAGTCEAAAVHETSATYDPTSGSTFSKSYQVYFGCPGNDNIGSDSKGDGMAFSFWKNSAAYNINAGACGGGLGYMGAASDGKMITLEFDTWSSQGNAGFDASYGGGSSGINDEIALQRDGIANDGGKISCANVGNLEDGLEHTVIITYVPGTHLLSVTIDGTPKFSQDLTGSPYDLQTYFGAGGLNQTWSAGKYGATDQATVSNGASIFANTGTTLSIPAPSLSNKAICAGDPAVTFDAGAGYSSYSWSANGSGAAQTTSGSTAGNYTVTVSNSAGCAVSATGVLTVSSATVAGSVTSDATVCSGLNGATLTLTGHNGTIVKWQSSIDNFATPIDIANVTTTQTYSNITASTQYRAVVKSGTCASANSAAASITVDAATVAGSVTSDATVCSGTNGATLTLAGHTGSIVKWQSSTDNFVTPVDIANVTTTQTYSNITASTQYRVVVKSGTCASANSSPASITVDAATVAGSITSDATVCSGTN
ncbi:MAG: hypothetical protein NT150_14855, partial [Bacteroidetes bacterium]|nr:hypothetical protein [Bacteroidota bacterium]